MDRYLILWLTGRVHTSWVVLVGAFTGLLGGLFGKGGSAIASPLLALGGIHPYAALASPLPATIPATLVAALAYRRAGHVDTEVLRTTVIVGLPATVLGALLSAVVGGATLLIVCDVIVALLGVRILLRDRSPDRILVGGPTPEPEHSGPARVVPVAITAGLISGLLANSGGFLLAPLFATFLGLPIKRALGTSLAAAAVLAVPGTIVHAALGHVSWSIAVPFGLASIPLSACGARLALGTDAGRLEVTYGVVLIVLGGGLLLVR